MSDEARAESIRRVNLRQRGAFDGLDMMSHGAAMAAWQAERDAERVAELEAEVERLNDALDAADVRYQMLGEWGERMKAEAEHLRAYAEKQDELIHRMRVRAEAAEAVTKSSEAWQLTRMPLRRILAEWRPGSHDWSWDDEYADLVDDDVTRQIEERVLDEGIGFTDHIAPVLLGSDGRVWDGHHRIVLAMKHGITELRVDEVERKDEDDE